MASKNDGLDFSGKKVKEIPTATRKNRKSKYDAAWDSATAGGIVEFGPYEANVANALRQRLVQLAEERGVNLNVETRSADEDGMRLVYAELKEGK